MKGKIITEKRYTSIENYRRGRKTEIKRIVIPDADNLAMTSFHGQFSVIAKFKGDGDVRFIDEIEVPDHIVEAAITLAKAEENFEKLHEEFKTILF